MRIADIIKPQRNSADLHALKAHYLAGAEAQLQMRPTLQAAVDDAVLKPSEHERASFALDASVKREAKLREMAADLEPLIAAAHQREASDNLLKRAAILRRQAAAEMKEYAKLEPHLAAVAALGERHQRTQWEIEQLNRELREAGKRDRVVAGVTYIERDPRFEDVQSATPAGLAHPRRFFHDLHIPALRVGTHPIWRGKNS